MNTFKPLLNLLPYLWPKGNNNFKIRFVLAICFLIFAKIANVSVPIFLGKAVDALDNLSANTLVIIVPVPMYLLSYASRFTQATNVSLILLLESILGPLWIWLGTGDQPADLTIFGGFIVIISTGSYLLLSKQN